MSGVVTSRVVPPDHLPRLAGMRPWDGGWLGAFAAFGRHMFLGWRVAGCVCRVWPGYVRKRRPQASRPWRMTGYVCGPDLEWSKARVVEGVSGRRLWR